MFKVSVQRQGQDSDKHLNVNLHNYYNSNIPKTPESNIDAWIQEGINWLHENERESYFSVNNADTIVVVMRNNTGYRVIVASPRQYAHVRLD